MQQVEERPRARRVRSRRSARAALAAVLAAAGTLALSACGGSGKSTADTSGGGAPHVGKQVAVVVPAAGPGYYQQMGCGARDEAKRLGFDIDRVQAPAKAQDAQTQANILAAVLARRPDGLIYAPVDAKGGAIPVRAAVSQGLKIANVDVQLADPSLSVTFVWSDGVAGGKIAADLLAQQLGDRGKVVAIGVVPDHPITKARIDGFEAGIKQHPGIDYLGARYPELDLNKLADETAAILRRTPDVVGIYTTNDTIATAVAVALRGAGLDGKVKVITWDAQPAGLKLMQAGTVTGTIVQRPREVGKLAAQQLANAFDGKPVQKEIDVPFVTMTNENMDTPENRALYYNTAC